MAVRLVPEAAEAARSGAVEVEAHVGVMEPEVAGVEAYHETFVTAVQHTGHPPPMTQQLGAGEWEASTEA